MATDFHSFFLQKELYVALNIVNLLIQIIAHCRMHAAKENAIVMLRCVLLSGVVCWLPCMGAHNHPKRTAAS